MSAGTTMEEQYRKYMQQQAAMMPVNPLVDSGADFYARTPTERFQGGFGLDLAWNESGAHLQGMQPPALQLAGASQASASSSSTMGPQMMGPSTAAGAGPAQMMGAPGGVMGPMMGMPQMMGAGMLGAPMMGPSLMMGPSSSSRMYNPGPRMMHQPGVNVGGSSQAQSSQQQQPASSSTSTKILDEPGTPTETISGTRGAFMEQAPSSSAGPEQVVSDYSAAEQMVEYLRSSGNPKFASSQFVSFIDKVTKGDLKFTEENTVVDAEGKEIDWDSLYDVEAANMMRDPEKQEAKTGTGEQQTNAQEMEDGLLQAEQFTEEMFEEAWRAAEAELHDMTSGDSNAASADNLFAQQGLGMTAPPTDFLSSIRTSEGQQVGPFDEPPIWGPGVSQISEYVFAAENPYLERYNGGGSSAPELSPMELALQLIREGKDQEAILVLEVEVQKDAENSEAWSLLGQLYANLDQDLEAIKCLVKAHEADPYNLDSLLQLGVSCTNELDQIEALRYLQKWIESHEDFGHLSLHGAAIVDVDGSSRDLSDFEKLRDHVTRLLNEAARNCTSGDKSEANVFVALGVVENVSRNFGAAVQALREAALRNPLDFSIWNKLGATLANSGNSEAAQTCYHQALSLKPNYARTWSNLAIAHSNLGQHEDAARFYLSSLVLNPKADHLWSFVHTAMINLASSDSVKLGGDRLAADYLRAAAERDMQKCHELIPETLTSKEDLPERAVELDMPVEEILAQLPTGEAIAKA